MSYDPMSDFSSAELLETNDEGFLNSNGIIAKVVFLIMIVILFVVFFYLSLMIMNYFYSTTTKPMLIDGKISGSNYNVISQNPANSASKTLFRSNNQETGIEFTWSVWLNYAGPNNDSKYNPVFIKGDATQNGVYGSINNGPGVYFGPGVSDENSSSNALYILMDTVTDTAKSNTIIEIPNLPINTFFHLSIRCQNTFIDVYINGNLVKRQNLGNSPKQNFYDVHVCPHGGFSGELSNLQYFDRSLTVVELNSIVQSGPKLKSITGSSFSPSAINVISTSWYNNFLL